MSGSHAALPQDVLPKAKKQYRNVVLFLVDAFGWCFFQRYKDRYPFLSRFEKEGCVSKITSQFPSTTAAHVTSLHTGVPVYESGIYEWFYYEPICGAVIAPLLFSYAGDNRRDVLAEAGFCAEQIFPNTNLYQALGSAGVTSHVFQNADYTPSTFTSLVCAGSKIYPYSDFQTALTQLADKVSTCADKNYFYFYYDVIDAAGHHHGPDSPEFEAATDLFFRKAEEIFFAGLAGQRDDTLIIVTADHGQEPVSPSTTYYIDLEIQGFERFIAADPTTGKLLAPAGSSRDLFLHIKPEHLAEAKTILTERLEEKAEVYTIEEIIGLGLFGPNVSTRLRERLGNLVVLGLEQQTIWWTGGGKFYNKFFGHHGGALKSEMESIFLSLAV